MYNPTPDPHGDVDVLDALGNDMRRMILRLLSEGPLAVGELAARLPVSRPAVSKHLRILESAALVEFERDGQRHLYRLEDRGLEAAREWLVGLRSQAARPPATTRVGARVPDDGSIETCQAG